jgi:hypothetical protein
MIVRSKYACRSLEDKKDKAERWYVLSNGGCE